VRHQNQEANILFAAALLEFAHVKMEPKSDLDMIIYSKASCDPLGALQENIGIYPSSIT
jgi:prepilin-type processing-associated H-X9-DG protein